MKPAGVILTYMTRQDWKGKKFWIKLRTIFFNAVLFVLQLAFMIAGTVYGKIKWRERSLSFRGLFWWFFVWCLLVIIPQWWLRYPLVTFWLFIAIATIRSIDWRRVSRAAQCSHVRLCLRKLPDREVWEFMNFGWPEAEIQRWTSLLISELDPKRFECRKPTFDPSPEFIKEMIQYAEAQVGKRYDDLQLISNGLHLIVWIVYPWCWGKELKVIKALNRPGGLEHCTSGFVACLRWAYVIDYHFSPPSAKEVLSQPEARFSTPYFYSYHTAVIPPCLVPLSKNWRVT